MAISIKNGWIFSAQELAKQIDPSATNLTNAKIAELVKSGKYTTELQLAIAAGIDVSAIPLKSGWVTTFTQIDKKLNP